MLDLPRNRLNRHPQQIRNPNDSELVVVVEPWAEQFTLKKEESIDIVFIGPDDGQPEVLPYPNQLVIYGWDGSEFIALRNGRLATRPPTVLDIVRQEFKIARQRLKNQDIRAMGEELSEVQKSLDAFPELQRKSQELAFGSAGYLICTLTANLERTPETTAMLWQIADRMVGTKAVILSAPAKDTLESEVWSGNPYLIGEVIRRHAISALPGPAHFRPGKRSSAKRQTSESRIDPKPR